MLWLNDTLTIAFDKKIEYPAKKAISTTLSVYYYDSTFCLVMKDNNKNNIIIRFINDLKGEKKPRQ